MSEAKPRVQVRRFLPSRPVSGRKPTRAYLTTVETLEGRALLSGALAGMFSSPAAAVSDLSETRANTGSPTVDPVRAPHGRHRVGGMNVARNIPFPTAGGRAQYLDLYRPPGPAPAGGWPVIVAIHGGGWLKYTKTEYGRRVASGFVGRGFAVVAPNYLLSRPGSPTWPINLQDVQASVRWIRSGGNALGLDSNRIVAMGESAGGHLAELLGTGSVAAPDSGVADRVSAVVAFSGPADLTTLFQRSPAAGTREVQFLGGPPGALPDAYDAASPVDQVASGNPPMLLVHGTADPIVPVGQSREMNAALAASGVSHRLILIRGGTHALDFPLQHANLIPRILAFLGTTWNHES